MKITSQKKLTLQCGGIYSVLGGNMNNKMIISKERSRHHKNLVRFRFKNINNGLNGGVI